jgi:hypothetical protein
LCLKEITDALADRENAVGLAESVESTSAGIARDTVISLADLAAMAGVDHELDSGEGCRAAGDRQKKKNADQG